MSNQDYLKIKCFFEEKLKTISLDQELIETTVSSLVETSLFGIDSHGVNLFEHYFNCLTNGRVKKGTELEIQRKGAVITCNAKNNLANYAARKIILELDQISNKYGIAIGSINNSDHIGAVGIHSYNSGVKNKIIMGFTNADALAVTPDGNDVIFGTNPISLIFQSKEKLTYIDLATTIFSKNKVKNYRRNKLNLPIGVARDDKLRKTTNPNKAEFLEAIGGHKGFALAYMVEILTSGLACQNHSKNLLPMYGTDLKINRGVSHTYLMINPSFLGLDTLSSIHDVINETIENVSKEQYNKLPGIKELSCKKERIISGIPVSDEILDGWINLGYKND